MAIKCYDKNNKALTHLTQWDENQQIIVKNVSSPTMPVVHATNARYKNSIKCVSNYQNTQLIFDVPNILLEEPFPLNIYINLNDSNNSIKTLYSIHIPVTPREKPEYTGV